MSRAPASPHWSQIAGTVAATLVLFAAVGAWTLPLDLPWRLISTEVLVFGAAGFLGWKWLGQPPLQASQFSSGARWAGWGLLLGGLNYFAAVVPIQLAMEAVLPAQWVQAYDSQQLFAQTPPELHGLLLLSICAVAPLCEEFYFRGTVQRGLLPQLGPLRAIWVSALVFSAFHFDPVGLLARFELGLLFGALAYRCGNGWAAVAAHAASNSTAALLLLVRPFFEIGTPGDSTELSGWMALPSLASMLGLWFFGRKLWRKTRLNPASLIPSAP